MPVALSAAPAISCADMSRRRLSLLIAVLLLPAAPAAAQIISVMTPTGTPTGSARHTVVHAMAGMSDWDFGTDVSQRRLAEAGGAVLTGSDHLGFIVAADGSTRLSNTLRVGFGGWYNHLSRQALEYPQGLPSLLIHEPFAFNVHQTFYSAYGGVSFRNFG